MPPRAQVEELKGSYFSTPNTTLDFIPSGCCIFDCSIGGGYPLGRISNIVGDRSTGKTLLAIEASANFYRKFPNGIIYYREAEAAFDVTYAEALGMPIDRVEFADESTGFYTVEDFYEDLESIIDKGSKEPILYIVDSLDALSDRKELERAIDKDTYAMNKAKKMSELLRKLNQKASKCNMHLMIISQIRDNIGVSFGKSWVRSGGRALDFYASQVIYLSRLQMIKRTKRGVERVVGVSIKSYSDKNKVSIPHRYSEFDIIFGWGIDDLSASIEWLRDVKRLDVIGLKSDADAKNLLREYNFNSDPISYKEKLNEVNIEVKKLWFEIEEEFMSKNRKYS